MSPSENYLKNTLPATLANTFLFILQGSALVDLRYSGRFYGTLSHS